MSTPDGKKQDNSRLRAAARRKIDAAPKDEVLARAAGRPVDDLLLELQVHQVELEMQNEALRQAQVALSESRDSYVDLYEFAPIGYLTLSDEGMIEKINLTGAMLLGRERNKLLQIPFFALVGKEDQDLWIRHMFITKQSDEHSNTELSLQRGDGTVFPVQLDCVRAESEAALMTGTTPMIGTPYKLRIALSDISERRQFESQLRESQKMEALGTLAGGIAHDFNNALALIGGNVELVRQDLGSGHPALDSLEEIDKATRRATDLVRQILTFGRRQLLDRKTTTLSLAVLEMARLVRATLPPGMTLNVVCKPNVPAVLADAAQIKQILLNLCGNAMQAAQNQGRPGVIEVRLEAHAQKVVKGDLQPGRYACLMVRDNGPGMDEATRARIFEPFFTTKPKGMGTGLGLSVVHGIVKTHEARIEVESTPGEGSTFRIYFPAVDASNAAFVGLGENGVSVNVRGKHILYIDDEEAIIFLMRRLLERQGYRVSGFTKPEDALAAARADPAQFDLAVTDYNMPEVSGLEVAIALRQIRPDLPVVMASGYVDEAMRAGALAAGIRKLIYKPDTVHELCEAVAHFANMPSGNK